MIEWIILAGLILEFFWLLVLTHLIDNQSEILWVLRDEINILKNQMKDLEGDGK